MPGPAPAYNPAMKLFALNASAGLGQRIADRLGKPLDPHEEREFSRGEHKARPLTDVRGEDVYVVASLHGDRDYSVNDKICRLVFFAGALKDAGGVAADRGHAVPRVFQEGPSYQAA